MSVIPFNNLRQADDFFSIYLDTMDAHRPGAGALTESPMWIFQPNQGILDRYKDFKRCWGVVDFVIIPRVNVVPLGALGGGIVLRMKNNIQPNSYEASDLGQTNIIYMCNGKRLEAGVETTAVTGITPPTHVGFPFEVMSPFSPIELYWTDPYNPDTPLDMGNAWQVKITYYFYRE